MCLIFALAAACAEGAGSSEDASGGGPDGGRIDGALGPDAPVAAEICDGQDNDMDQFVDEGTAEELCGIVDHGTPRCNGLGGCSVDGCELGFTDVDALFSTGCECAQEAGEVGSTVCEEGMDLGELADTNTEMVVVGNITPVGDVDYYRFRAKDNPDNSCDNFHVRVLFLDNPGEEFKVDVLRGGCGGTQICEGATDAQWYTNFKDANVPATGQCPCVDPATPSSTVNNCEDDSAEFVVRVSRASGKPLSCTSYRLEISNGKYSAP